MIKNKQLREFYDDLERRAKKVTWLVKNIFLNRLQRRSLPSKGKNISDKYKNIPFRKLREVK